MAGLDPAIHANTLSTGDGTGGVPLPDVAFAWMAGTSPAMTMAQGCELSSKNPAAERSGAVRHSFFMEAAMPKFSLGDHVSWNSEAGRVSGRIIKIHVADFDYKGHPRRASQEAPQYEIKSDKTDHVAAHREEALTRIA